MKEHELKWELRKESNEVKFVENNLNSEAGVV